MLETVLTIWGFDDVLNQRSLQRCSAGIDCRRHGNPTIENSINSRAAPFIPSGKKAGSAGGRAVPFWKDHLGWWYDWTPSPTSVPGVASVSMLWGGGHNVQEDAKRFASFQKLASTPQYLLGFNEPDCTGQDTSANLGFLTPSIYGTK
ncbi:glycoside superfamily [Fusarium denticulatum]|uniref:Glycoside superfamily n=1 Tax=Fusarium denticulatum TaxID=48507 RepID=A0A8H6CU27_9HYPO|nr:glycoside superfamily [Fusarium denticulatum]